MQDINNVKEIERLIQSRCNIKYENYNSNMRIWLRSDEHNILFGSEKYTLVNGYHQHMCLDFCCVQRWLGNYHINGNKSLPKNVGVKNNTPI